MNAPTFDVTRVTSPYGSAAWINERYAEENRCCEAIDNRITQLKIKSLTLHSAMDELERTYTTTKGFFARLNIRVKMRANDKMRENIRIMLVELYDARHLRTMT